MRSVGYAELSTMISMAVIVVWQPRLNDSTSNSPSARRNFIKFSDARLHALSSRNMYSEHGFDALMRAVWMHGCQSLMVVSYCIPGSPQIQAASAIFLMRPRAECVSTTDPLVTDLVVHSTSRMTAFMK